MGHRRGAIAAAFLLVVVGAGLVSAADPPIATPAPAFTAQQLLAVPRTAWITNGGTLYNQRYSSLSLINRDNVNNLRALWRTAMGSGTSPGHAGQAQILAYEGVLYVVNGANDVFAMDVETSAIRWRFEGKPDLRAGSPIGRTNRGVALGEGKVFVGLADGRLTALDQGTGQIRLITTTGRNNMPTFREIYDANQIRDVAEYIATVLPGKGTTAVKP